MKTILEIFKTDIKQVLHNPMALIVAIGIIILPGIYAWTNIDSNWNPYENTSNMPIAIASEDEGMKFLNEDVNIGQTLIQELSNNNDVKWIFADKDTAISGTNSGEYYGAIIIPTNFTSQVATLFNDSEVTKPRFDFYINQKKNPVSPIIVEKVAGAIETRIEQSFVNEVMYKIVEKAEVFNSDSISTAKVTKELRKVQDDILQLKNTLNAVVSASNSTGEALKATQDLSSLVFDNLGSSLDTINFQSKINNLNSAYNKFDQEINGYINTISSSIAKIRNTLGKAGVDENVINKVTEPLERLKSTAEQIKNQYNSTIEPLLNDLVDSLSSASKNLSSTVDSTKKAIEKGNLAINSIINALNETNKAAEHTNQLLDGIHDGIDELIGSIAKITESEIYLSLMNLLQNPPETVADFIAAPIETNEINLYMIDNYGSKMAPFYTALAAWVGCTILVSVLKTDIDYKNKFKKIKPYQAFWGRFLIFALIALIQGFVIATGDILLGVQATNYPLFIITAMIISFVFIIIVYSLTISFGKIGAALAVVILVLQVAGSGGTFPIELLPRFFQILQPMMPFAPALSMLREVVGGFYSNEYLISLLYLFSQTIIPLLLGLVFRKPIISIKNKLSDELEKSHLIG